MTEPWKAQRKALGAFIRAQRQMANLSLRQLAELTSLSNPYLSQIERGLHEPSIRVLKAISDALDMSTETLLAQAGLIDGPLGGPSPEENAGQGLAGDEAGRGTRADATQKPQTEDVIRADERLNDEQRAALIAVYRSMVG